MPSRILVTGGTGQLGQDVVHAGAARGLDVVGMSRTELDILDASRVREVVEGFDAVIHCAAWTAVDDAEEHRAAAFELNETGTGNVAAAARSAGAALVLVSTDYVFDGEDPAGYTEDATPAPVNAYGASKLAAEHAALAAHPDVCIARTAWLFGARGTNFVRTIARLAADRDVIEVVTDQVGSPTWTGHLATALIECVERRLTGIVHLAGTPTATWFEVAQEVVALSGAECQVNPTTTDAFPRPARRPSCSILRTTRRDAPEVGDWREGVRAVLQATQAPAVT